MVVQWVVLLELLMVELKVEKWDCGMVVLLAWKMAEQMAEY